MRSKLKFSRSCSGLSYVAIAPADCRVPAPKSLKIDLNFVLQVVTAKSTKRNKQLKQKLKVIQ